MIDGDSIRKAYLDFFASHGHKIVPSAPLVPENDPTTLFTGSGMQPMLPYLLGQEHPLGTRIVDSQKCFRAQDIEEVGDNRHDTFFEMLGNWSLGDYFKTEQLAWFYEFLTKKVGLSPERLYVSVFKGDSEIPKDEEAVAIWKSLGMPEDHIYFYDDTKNWWSRAGKKANMPVGEPGGPDSEVFYDFGADLGLHAKSPWASEVCHPNCDCGRFMEIGNSVFMTYLKTETGFVPLEKKNIDFGGGLERIAAAANHNPDVFATSLFQPLVDTICSYTSRSYTDLAYQSSIRVIADHMKAAVFLINDGVLPSNKAQGYFLRRLLRRAMVKMQVLLGDISQPVDNSFYEKVLDQVYSLYKASYFSHADFDHITQTVITERDRFSKTLRDGLKLVGKVSPFDLFQTYGFPVEVTQELLSQQGIAFDQEEFDSKLKEHQQLSRTASAGMFKGGLLDHSDVTTRYHTATHLLHKALRDVLGSHVGQKGSNITGERLRFDFSHSQKLTDSELKQVEDTINAKIAEDLPVTFAQRPKAEALAEGALAFFPEKYPDVTTVYSIGNYSKELCGGPHVTSTSQVGRIKITKEESAGAGVRRIYAQFANP